MFLRSVLPAAALCVNLAAALDKQVFAHYIVGLTSGQSRDEWQQDISDAKGSGIDGFALNIGAQDSYTDEQLALVYDVASANGFSLFLSFDMAASQWDADHISQVINAHKDASSQYKINGKPVVSTFEGPGQAEIWPGVRSSTGDIFFIPDWASLGADGVGSKGDLIDGAFNWGAWPEPNQKTMSTGNDDAYKRVLGDKPYMMGVSPYFYTNLPQYNKNWYSSSDSLWFDRWKQALEIDPALIEIITWNDFGESSYINNPSDHGHQIVDGSQTYVNGFDHTAFRFVLPYFISAYKAGNTDVQISEGAVAWYRTTPAKVCGDGSTVWGQGGSGSASDGTDDVINIIALTGSSGDITVKIGGDGGSVSAKDTAGKASFYQVPINGRTGQVTVEVNGKSSSGPEISNNCPSSGHVNFNSVSFQV
ncbi:glycoside hydrolase family 71 protein [Astrocystis sublimbata]|nr:glycoside hydrolase family 71 protein [Astrocystis sublimbata]